MSVPGVKFVTPTHKNVMQMIKHEHSKQYRARMIARLLEHQTLDVWMTYELMEAAIKWVGDKKPLEITWRMVRDVQTRDKGSSTTADLLQLQNTPVDSFYNFQSIRVNGGQSAMRHTGRPDVMYLMHLETTRESEQPMVMFYEGDVHGKDDNKTMTSGCKNSHKMYQAIAQAQSKNPNMAGCAIFAAMQFAPTDKLIEFLDDMLTAHIYVCVAIADWNSHIQEQRRKTTLIGSVFGNTLKYNMQYDFVFGINMGLEQGTPDFQDTEFRSRIDDMLAPMNQAFPGALPMDIQLNNDIANVAEYFKTTTKVGCVPIVICAIPRQKKEILQVTPAQPMFIYPLHVETYVRMDGATKSVAMNAFDTTLTLVNPLAVPNASLNFLKNMMRMSAVLTGNNPPGRNACLLTQTNGFFLAALPLAYYTIQQFEFVNVVLKYAWMSAKYDVRQMVDKLKYNKEKLTGDLKVTMFVKNQSSLFHTICASVEQLPKLETDFQMFLTDCCRWRENDNALPGSSPTILFRTLGIFSLQNAIDFACDIQANPNKTYSSLLASYPAGTQMLIQQSMKRLSSNEAYAYIGREDLDNVTNTQVPKVADEDEDESKLGLLLRAEKYVIKVMFHSTWSVSWEQAPATQAPRQEALSAKLLKQYQDSVRHWSCKTLEANDLIQQGVQPEKDLREIWMKYLESKQIYDTASATRIPLPIPANLYDPSKAYSIKCVPENRDREYSYVLTANLPQQLKYSSSEDMRAEKDRAEYTATWGSFLFKFTLLSKDVADSFVKAITSQSAGTLERIKQFLEQKGDYQPTEEDLREMDEMLQSSSSDTTEVINEIPEVPPADLDGESELDDMINSA